MFREMRRKKQLLSEAEDGPNLQTRNVGDPGGFWAARVIPTPSR